MGEPEAGGLLHKYAVDNDDQAPSKNSALKHTCCSSSEVSHLASTAEAMAASNWSRIAGSDRPARPVLCNQQWPNQRMARLKVGGGLGPGPSHRPGTRSLRLPPSSTPLSILTMTALGSAGSARDRRATPVFSPSRAGIGSAVSSKSNTSKLAAIRAGFTDCRTSFLEVPAQHHLGRRLAMLGSDMGDDRVVEDAAPAPSVAGDAAWQIRPDGLSRVNELRLPRQCQVTRTGAQGVPPAPVNTELLQFLTLWASESPPLAQCRSKSPYDRRNPRRGEHKADPGQKQRGRERELLAEWPRS